MANKAPLVLMILDGWGYSDNPNHNAIAQAKTPNWDQWWREYPHTLLDAAGQSVGLPEAQMGNSEVGHMHIGAGRVIQQDLTRINQAIYDGGLDKNPLLIKLAKEVSSSQNALHIMGLLSPGGVHSHEHHLFNLLAFYKKQNLNKIYLHLFLDGRDTPPQSALASIGRLKKVIAQYSLGEISSICGRYYAMDRDQRWERIEPAYRLITEAVGAHHFADAQEAINFYYQQGLTDEFIPPTPIGKAHPIKDGDFLFFFNFRADRARQLTSAFVDPNFSGFQKNHNLQLQAFITLTQFDKHLPTHSVFPPISMENTFGEVVANHGLKQLRIAETEKYAHVTFFFNGGKEELLTNETRILIPSPKVATYDLQPEMSAPELTDAIVKAINIGEYDVIICNYANADMVGHSGNFKATIRAIECLDQCMAKVWDALSPLEGKLLITADHGNAEEMFDETTHQAHTAHTSEPVPLLYVGKGWHFNSKKIPGSLIDIAPTVLHLLGITPPPEMNGAIIMEREYEQL